MPLWLQGLYQLVLLIFFSICNFLKDLFLYLLYEICFGKKKKFLQFYFFGDEGNSICHTVTNSVQSFFLQVCPNICISLFYG